MTTDEELFGRHFTYEVWMLIETRGRLLIGVSDLVVRNALIESFCIHARQLIDFFNGKGGSDASTFADAAYIPFASGSVPADLITKLNTQIAHLTYKRTANPKDKIDHARREELFQKVCEEVANLVRHLRPEYCALWPDLSVTPSLPIPQSPPQATNVMEGTSLGVATTTTSTST